METNPVLAYGQWIAEAPRAWPDAALESAHRQFIDVVAVIVPGAAEPVTRRVFETVKDWGIGPCVAAGTGARLAAPWAALVNGTAAHALDFDDNFDPAKAHATAVLVPAILALAEQEGASGADCIDAYIASLQILGRVGQGVNPAHRNRGWHATATVGAIGAAAACARLLRLDAKQSAYAISIATSMAAGFMSQFGTMTKPLHAGLAARSGIMAASLAKNGIDAGLHTLDGPTGMNRLMVGPDYEHLRDTLTHVEHGQNLRFETQSIGDPLLILSSGFRVKRFPNCGSAHRTMDGVLALKDAHGFTVDDVERIDVRAPVTHLNNLMYTDPQDGLQAKFSLEYGAALILLTGRAALSDFTDAAAMRPEIRALYPRIHRHPVDKAEGEFPTEIEIVLKDGRRFVHKAAMPMGSIAAPFPTSQYWVKFENCAGGLMDKARMAALRAALEALPDLPTISALTAPLAPPLSAPYRRALRRDKGGRMTDTRYTCLVLAANRRGAADPLAQAGGVSHKAFIDIAGQPMLRRVVQAALESGRIGRLIVSIEPDSEAEARAILGTLPGADRISYVGSRENIGASVMAVTDAQPDVLPLVITTGDNALHTAEMVRFFCDALDDETADGALGLTPASYILEKYPEGNRAFHRFTDGEFSSCNLYALLTPKSLKAPRTFNSGGQFAKKPWRLILSFGLLAFLIYKSRRFKLRTVLGVLSRGVGVKTAPVLMPFAEGPIDVDRMQDWKLANRIVAERESKPVPA